MRKRTVGLLAVSAVVLLAAAAKAFAAQTPEFQEALDKASRDARANGDREATARAERDAAQDRSNAGIGHEGRASVSDGVSVGARSRDGGGEVNVRIDYDPQ